MANAFEAIFNDEEQKESKDTSVSFDIVKDFQKETSEIAKDKSKINPTYEEIFNITKDLDETVQNFNTVDNQTQEQFRQKASQISKEYSEKISDITSDPNLTDSEKRFEVQSSLNKLVDDITDEAKPILQKSANVEKIQSNKEENSDDEVYKDYKFSESGSIFATEESLDGASERIDSMKEQVKNSYTIENAEKTLDTVYNNAITDLSHIAVTEVMGSIVNSDTIAYTVNPMLLAKDITESIVDSAMGIVASAKEAVIDTPLDISDRFLDYGKGFINSLTQVPADLAKNSVTKAKAALNDKVDSILTSGSLKGTTVTGTESLFDVVRIEKVKRSDFRVVNATTQKGFVIDSVYMSLDNFWDVDIVVPIENKGLPSFRESYGLDEYDSYHLPVSSFSFNGEAIHNIDQEMYPGLSMPLPMVFQKPSKFSIQIPELVHRFKGSAVSCLLNFKQQYIDYVMGNNKTSYVFKDFRSCAYTIIIKKYSLRWELLKVWCYYGIPDVSIAEMGSSSPTVEYGEISFSIIGDSWNPKPYSNIDLKEFVSTVASKANDAKNAVTNII